MQNVLLKAEGLYSYPNRLSSVPQGALLAASNVVINRENIVESRRGFKLYGDAFGTSTDSAHQLFSYKSRILRHWGSGAGQYLEYDDGSGAFSKFSVSLTGDTVDTDATISSLSTTSSLFVGMYVTGDGIPSSTRIASITNNTTIELTNNATITDTGVALTFIFDVAEVEAGLRIKAIEANGNFYLTTSKGIKKVSVSSASGFTTAVISQAGGVSALDLKADINNNTGFFTAQSVVAYKLLWGIKDANQNLITGSPSERVVLRNLSMATKTVNISFTIPKEITSAYFYQLYRTRVFADSTSPGTQDPGDELQLVYENNPTSAQLTAGSISLTDITPESFLGGYLYTNADTGEGILQANDLPPLAKDIASFKGYTFYANTTTRQRLDLSLLSISAMVSGTSELIISDGTTTTTYTFTSSTISCDTTDTSTTVVVPDSSILTPGASLSGSGIPSNAYIVRIIDATSIEISAAATATASSVSLIFATEDASAQEIALSQFATPAQQVDETARSLVRIINKQSSELVYAYYMSGVDDVPGLLAFEARSLEQDAFYLQVDDDATTGTQFNPVLPETGESVISDNEVNPNRIYYSKFQQPEAVPLLNYLDIGPKDKPIYRILALRDSLYVLKEEGVYRISNNTAPFVVNATDLSTSIKAPDSAVVLNNLIYMFADQGIATVSDTGVAVISYNIEDELKKLITPTYTSFDTATFGISYESDRSYYLFTVSQSTDTQATQCFRFNTFTNTWTKLLLEKRCGIVHSDDLLYLGPTDTNYIEQERKSFSRTDFADRERAITLSSISGTSIIVSSTTGLNVDDVITQTQYLTISKFNRLLSKLDRDSLLSPHDYRDELLAVAGDNLSTKLDSLITKIAADTGRTAVGGATAGASYTALSPVATGFSAQQTAFNAVVALLNADVGVGYSDYTTSTGTIDYELPVLAIDTNTNTITTDYSYPIIAGSLTAYNHIETNIQFVPQFLSDVSITKQVSEGTFIFEDVNFSKATVAYASDLSGGFESITITGAGNGTFGNMAYGTGPYGGSGSGIPFRTYIPRNKQRCRYLNCKLTHKRAREIFSLYGISLSFIPVSNRGYR
jgi:hypothetical protein